MKTEQLVKKYYSIDAKTEWNRLTKDAYHRLEFETTMRFLRRYLPKKKGLILDAGGGPGRYSIELAKQGYKVILLDLVSENLELAKKQINKEGVERNISRVIQGSIIDLSMFPTDHFDSVLCLGGPLSHIEKVTERKKAVKELSRVGKKNAKIFISVIGKLGTIIRTPIGWPEEAVFTENMQSMVLRGDDHRWRSKYFAHYFTLDELKKLIESSGAKVIDQVGLEGISNPSEKAINRLAKNKKAWQNWLDAHYKLCTHPSMADTSSHFMVVAKNNS